MEGRIMKIKIILGILSALFLVGCGPSEGEIQTAIAETEAAQTTPTGSPRLDPPPESTPTLVPTPTVPLVSENDLAVCEAYQNLVNAWPDDSPAVKAAGSAQDIYLAIEETGAELATAGHSADNPELGQAGVNVGNAALRNIEMDEAAREIGFVPFFDETLIGGGLLSQLCLEMGRPISRP